MRLTFFRGFLQNRGYKFLNVTVNIKLISLFAADAGGP